MSRQNARLPIPPTAPKPAPFPIGSRVLMRVDPDGEPGVVRAIHRGRIEVYWPTLSFKGRHKASSLIVVGVPLAKGADSHE